MPHTKRWGDKDRCWARQKDLPFSLMPFLSSNTKDIHTNWNRSTWKTAVAVNFHQLYPQNQQSSCLKKMYFPMFSRYAVFFGCRLFTSTERNFFTPSSGGSWLPFRSDSWEGNCGTKPPISLRQARKVTMYNGQTPCNMSDVKRWFNRFLQQPNSCPLSIRIFWAHQDLKKSEAFEAFGIPVTP